MHQIVYTSTAQNTLTDEDLRTILETSRQNNSQRGVTGLLLFKEGRFLQVLEGDEETLRGLYETIQADDRHYNVVLLFEEETPGREFGEWAMGFSESLDNMPDEGVSTFFEEGFTLDAMMDQSRVKAFLHVFRGIARG